MLCLFTWDSWLNVFLRVWDYFSVFYSSSQTDGLVSITCLWYIYIYTVLHQVEKLYKMYIIFKIIDANMCSNYWWLMITFIIHHVKRIISTDSEVFILVKLLLCKQDLKRRFTEKTRSDILIKNVTTNNLSTYWHPN